MYSIWKKCTFIEARRVRFLRVADCQIIVLSLAIWQTTVVKVEKCKDFSTTGRWTVVTEREGKQESFIFDAVMVCTGHQIEAYTPLHSFPGMALLMQVICHSMDSCKPLNAVFSSSPRIWGRGGWEGRVSMTGKFSLMPDPTPKAN